MPVAFDAATTSQDVDFGTSIATAHTPVGTPRAVLALGSSRGGADPSASTCTYGGTAMTAVQREFEATLNIGAVVFFLGSSVPTGAQTADWSIGTNGQYQLTVITLTASGDCEVTVSAVQTGASQSSPSQSLALGGATAFAALVATVGTGLDTNVSLLSGWGSSVNEEYDYGSQLGICASYDTISTSDVTAGLTYVGTYTTAFAAVAVNEIASGGGGGIMPITALHRRRRGKFPGGIQGPSNAHGRRGASFERTAGGVLMPKPKRIQLLSKAA